jgi:hypothetical protein
MIDDAESDVEMDGRVAAVVDCLDGRRSLWGGEPTSQ